jgi:hypothetical protein
LKLIAVIALAISLSYLATFIFKYILEEEEGLLWYESLLNTVLIGATGLYLLVSKHRLLLRLAERQYDSLYMNLLFIGTLIICFLWAVYGLLDLISTAIVTLGGVYSYLDPIATLLYAREELLYPLVDVAVGLIIIFLRTKLVKLMGRNI